MTERITDNRMSDDIKEVERKEDLLTISRGEIFFFAICPVCQSDLCIGETQVVDIKGVWGSKLYT